METEKMPKESQDVINANFPQCFKTGEELVVSYAVHPAFG
jgi:hypothetical protein